MAIMVKLSTSLRACVDGYDPMSGLSLEAVQGETAAGLIKRLGLDPAKIKIIMINGRAAQPDASVKDGDRVGLFPPVGGG